MMEEEEEVLFDQAGLLTNRIKHGPEVKIHVTSIRVIKTFFLCAAFFGLGLCIAIPGPTLLDLQARTHTDTETISRIFIGRSVGYLLGSIAGGLMFDKINQDCLLSFALLLTAVGTALAPWSTNFLLLTVLFAFQGISMGFLDTGGNVVCIDIWGRNSAPYMQSLHFAFGLGAFVAPLIAEPFLSSQYINITNTTESLESQTILPTLTPPDLSDSHNKRSVRGIPVVPPIVKPWTESEEEFHQEAVAYLMENSKTLNDNNIFAHANTDGARIGMKVREKTWLNRKQLNQDHVVATKVDEKIRINEQNGINKKATDKKVVRNETVLNGNVESINDNIRLKREAAEEKSQLSKENSEEDMDNAVSHTASGGDLNVTATTSGKPKPKKPRITDARHLSQDHSVADGTKNDKEIRTNENNNKNKEDIIKEVAATQPPPRVIINCNNVTNNDSSVECDGDVAQQMADLHKTAGDVRPTSTTTTTTTTPTTTTTTTTTTMPPTTTTTTMADIKDNENNVEKIPGIGDGDDVEEGGVPTPTVNPSTTETHRNITNGPGKVQQLLTQMSGALQNMTKVEFAYITIASFLFVVSVMFMCLCCFGSRSLHSVRSTEIQGEYIIHKESKGFRIQILILLFIFYFLYVGMEVTYGGLIMTFAVKYLNWSKQRATYLTSVFWGSFAFGRGLAIPLSKCMSPVLLLISDLVLTCLSLAGLVLVMETSHTMLWFCTITIGVGMSSIFPTGITWAERYMHITGKATAVFVVGSALGEMAIPALTGYLFQAKGPMWLIYVMLGCGLISAVLYIIMQNLASNKGERYERLNSLLTLASDDTDEMELEMDSVSVSSSMSNHNHNNVPIAGNSANRKKVTFKLPIDSPSSSPRSAIPTTRKNGTLLGKSNTKND